MSTVIEHYFEGHQGAPVRDRIAIVTTAGGWAIELESVNPPLAEFHLTPVHTATLEEAVEEYQARMSGRIASIKNRMNREPWPPSDAVREDLGAAYAATKAAHQLLA